MSAKKGYSVYVHVFPNGKKYFGITSQEPERRWRNGGLGYLQDSQGRMKNAILKYGWVNVAHIILLTGVSLEEAREAEIRLISDNDSANPDHGYNLTCGGEGPNRWTQEMREKMSRARRGKPGHPHTEETKKKIGLANSLRIFTPITLANMSKASKTYYSDPDVRQAHSLRQPASRPVVQRDIATGAEIARFHSCGAAARSLGKRVTHIWEACKKNESGKERHSTAFGYYWTFGVKEKLNRAQEGALP